MSRRYFQSAASILETPLLTVREVAQLLHFTPSGVYKAVRYRGLPVKRLSRRCLRFERRAVEQWIEEQQHVRELPDMESALRLVRP